MASLDGHAQVAKTSSPLLRDLHTVRLQQITQHLGICPKSRISKAIKAKPKASRRNKKRKSRAALQEVYNTPNKSQATARTKDEGKDTRQAAKMASMADIGLEADPYQADLNNTMQCNDCGVPTLLQEEVSSGDIVCTECGLVVGARIVDMGSEWRTFANDEAGDDPSRVGDAGNEIYGPSALETKVDMRRDQGASYKIMKSLNAANKKIQNEKGQAAINAGMAKIKDLVDKIHGGGNVIKQAQSLFREVEEAKALKGKSADAAVAGCIFIACRMEKVPRTFREIHALTNVSKKEIGRTYKALEEYVKKVNYENRGGAAAVDHKMPTADDDDDDMATKGTTAESLCTRYCSILGFRVSHLAERVAMHLARKSSSVADLAGRSPLSVAAACIYMMSHLIGEPRTSKDIAVVAGVSDGTIKTAYKFLLAAKDELCRDGEFDPATKQRREGLNLPASCPGHKALPSV